MRGPGVDSRTSRIFFLTVNRLNVCKPSLHIFMVPHNLHCTFVSVIFAMLPSLPPFHLNTCCFGFSSPLVSFAPSHYTYVTVYTPLLLGNSKTPLSVYYAHFPDWQGFSQGNKRNTHDKLPMAIFAAREILS